MRFISTNLLTLPQVTNCCREEPMTDQFLDDADQLDMPAFQLGHLIIDARRVILVHFFKRLERVTGVLQPITKHITTTS